MTGTEGDRGRRGRGAVGSRQEQRPARARRRGREAAGEPPAVRALRSADRDGIAGVDLAVAWCGRAPHDPGTSGLAELVGVGSAFDGTEWHFYAVNVEPMPGLEWDASQRSDRDAAPLAERDHARLGVR